MIEKARKNEKDKSKQDNKVSVWVFVLFGVSMILFPILINSSLFGIFPSTPSDLGNAEWLSFWGSFIGGAIGGVATLIAISYTLIQNSRYHIELMKTQYNSNQMILDNQNEMKRVDVMPFISFAGKFKDRFTVSTLDSKSNINLRYEKIFDFPETYFIFDKDISWTTKLNDPYKKLLNNNGLELKGNSLVDTGVIEQSIEICNLGLGSAINVIVDLLNQDKTVIKKMLLPPFNIINNKPIEWRLVFGEHFTIGTYFIKFSMMDIQCKYFYEQKIKIIYSQKNFSYENISKPVLIEDYSNRLK